MAGKTRNDDLYNKLHEEYFADLVRWCVKYVGYTSELRHYAEDFAQEAFIRALRFEDKFLQAPNKFNWLRAACRYAAIWGARKKQVRNKHTPVRIDEDENRRKIGVEETIEKWVETEDNKDTLRSIVSVLTVRQEEVYEDYFVAEMSAKEVAEKQKKKLPAIKSTIKGIRKKGERVRKRKNNYIFSFWVVSFWIANALLV